MFLNKLAKYTPRIVLRGVITATFFVAGIGRAGEPDFQINPQSATLNGSYARLQLQVASTAYALANERSDDLTDRATFQSSNPHVIAVSPAGRLLAVGNGTATVNVTIGAMTHSVVMRSESGTVRYIEAEHNFALKPDFARFAR